MPWQQNKLKVSNHSTNQTRKQNVNPTRNQTNNNHFYTRKDRSTSLVTLQVETSIYKCTDVHINMDLKRNIFKTCPSVCTPCLQLEYQDERFWRSQSDLYKNTLITSSGEFWRSWYWNLAWTVQLIDIDEPQWAYWSKVPIYNVRHGVIRTRLEIVDDCNMDVGVTIQVCGCMLHKGAWPDVTHAGGKGSSSIWSLCAAHCYRNAIARYVEVMSECREAVVVIKVMYVFFSNVSLLNLELRQEEVRQNKNQKLVLLHYCILYHGRYILQTSLRQWKSSLAL